MSWKSGAMVTWRDQNEGEVVTDNLRLLHLFYTAYAGRNTVSVCANKDPFDFADAQRSQKFRFPDGVQSQCFNFRDTCHCRLKVCIDDLEKKTAVPN